VSKPDCIFCQIVDDESPASIVYRDNTLMGFMDIQPVTRGHVLLIPRAHAERIADLPANIGEVLFAAATRITSALYGAMRCEGVNWFVADGAVAGQEVFHFHLHIIPRYHQDGFGIVHPPDYRDLPAREELDRAAEGIRESLQYD
jgi:diadenosine tetraphosphate (Ap4A) HIT family hydrolase